MSASSQQNALYCTGRCVSCNRIKSFIVRCLIGFPCVCSNCERKSLGIGGSIYLHLLDNRLSPLSGRRNATTCAWLVGRRGSVTECFLLSGSARTRAEIASATVLRHIPGRYAAYEAWLQSTPQECCIEFVPFFIGSDSRNNFIINDECVPGFSLRIDLAEGKNHSSCSLCVCELNILSACCIRWWLAGGNWTVGYFPASRGGSRKIASAFVERPPRKYRCQPNASKGSRHVPEDHNIRGAPATATR